MPLFTHQAFIIQPCVKETIKVSAAAVSAADCLDLRSDTLRYKTMKAALDSATPLKKQVRGNLLSK